MPHAAVLLVWDRYSTYVQEGSLLSTWTGPRKSWHRAPTLGANNVARCRDAGRGDGHSVRIRHRRRSGRGHRDGLRSGRRRHLRPVGRRPRRRGTFRAAGTVAFHAAEHSAASRAAEDEDNYSDDDANDRAPVDAAVAALLAVIVAPDAAGVQIVLRAVLIPRTLR